MDRYRTAMKGAGADQIAMRDLLRGETLRGVADARVAGLTHDLAVVPAEPEDDFHRKATVDAICRLVPRARPARYPAFPSA
jgi:hypothetical protein